MFFVVLALAATTAFILFYFVLTWTLGG